jgi:hypothetical protein
MIKISSDERELNIMGAKLTHLKTFPLNEIDNEDIQLACKSYRNDNSSLLSCLTYLRKYDDYFYNWYLNNKACNFFYSR